MTHLESAVSDLLAGRISVPEARKRAAELPTLDELAAWQAELANLLETTMGAKDPARAADLADIARAAVGPVESETRTSILLQIGQHLWDLKNWSAALPFFSTTTEQQGESANPGALWFHFDILRRLDRDDEALELAPKVIARLGERRDMQIAVILEQAFLLRRHGRLDDAIHALNDAVAILQATEQGETDSASSLHEVLLRLGDYTRLAGRLDAAISAFEQARSAALTAGVANRAAFALSELGYTYRNAGEADRGTRLLKAAAAEALRLGLMDDALRWDSELQGIELPEDQESSATRLQRAANLVEVDPEKALVMARECVKAGVETGNSFFEAEARNIAATGLNQLGRRQEAWLAYRAALKAAIRSGDLMAQFHVLGNLADLHFRQMKRDEFDRVSAEAVRIGEQMLRSAASGETRQMIAAAISRVYDRMAFFSAVTYTPPGSSAKIAPDPLRVLDISQRMRARNLIRWLAIRPYLDTAVEADRHAIIALRTADITVEATAGEQGEALRDLIRQRTEAEAALRARELNSSAPLVVDDAPVIFNAAELSAALRPHEILVDVMSLMDAYLVNCVTSDGKVTTSAFNSLQPNRRAALVRLRAAREKLLAADHQGSASEAEAEYNAAWAPLDEILTDVADQVAELGSGVKRIYVSPQMEFFAFPWWKLDECVGDVEICILPVPGALPLLRNRPPGNQPLARLLLIPDTTGTLRNAGADVAHVPHERCDGDAADILRALPEASTLHFGGHGHFDAKNAYFSGFLVRQSAQPDPLSRPDPSKKPRPGLALLTAAQILARADLPTCDLAVLAACRTGIPRQHAANEFTSLPSAMLLAGARAVVASLWDTSDPAAALLMQEFYRGIVAGQGPSTALANARRSLKAIDRDEVIARLGTDEYVPAADQPFGREIYTDPFQYYGIA